MPSQYIHGKEKVLLDKQKCPQIAVSGLPCFFNSKQFTFNGATTYWLFHEIFD